MASVAHHPGLDPVPALPPGPASLASKKGFKQGGPMVSSSGPTESSSVKGAHVGATQRGTGITNSALARMAGRNAVGQYASRGHPRARSKPTTSQKRNTGTLGLDTEDGVRIFLEDHLEAIERRLRSQRVLSQSQTHELLLPPLGVFDPVFQPDFADHGTRFAPPPQNIKATLEAHLIPFRHANFVPSPPTKMGRSSPLAFFPVPNYFDISLAPHGVRQRDQFVHAYPTLPRWENVHRTRKFLDSVVESAVEARDFGWRPDVLRSMFDHDTFKPLEGDAIILVTSLLAELEAKLASVRKEQTSAFELFEQRTGLSLDETTRQLGRLSNGSSLVEEAPVSLLCDQCGKTFCLLHAQPKDLACAVCGTRGCLEHTRAPNASKNVSSWKATEKDALLRLVSACSSVSHCDLALILAKPCWEVANHHRLLFPEDPKTASPPRPHKGRKVPPQTTPIGTSLGYQPCAHSGLCQLSTEDNRSNGQRVQAQCSCSRNGTYCDRFCGCPASCGNRFSGCSCQKCTLQDCKCRRAKRECDPMLCHNRASASFPSSCGVRTLTTCKVSNQCRNGQVRLFQRKLTAPINSAIPNAGFGLVMLECANKGDFLGLYGGELLTSGSLEYHVNLELIKAENWISFWFDVDVGNAVDSVYSGNAPRFINSLQDSSRINALAQTHYVHGTHQISIVATKRIEPGQEVIMYYGDGYAIPSRDELADESDSE